MIWRTDNVSLSSCFDIGSLELQARLPGRFGERLDAPVILITTAIVNDLLDAFRFREFGDDFSDDFRRRNVAAPLDVLLHVGVERAGRDDRLVLLIVDHLHADVFRGAMYAKTRPLGGADQALAGPDVNSAAMRLPRQCANWCCHVLSPPGLGRGLRAGLASLLLQSLAGDADALLLIRVGRTQRAQIRSNL